MVFAFILSCIYYKHTMSRKTIIKDMVISLTWQMREISWCRKTRINDIGQSMWFILKTRSKCLWSEACVLKDVPQRAKHETTKIYGQSICLSSHCNYKKSTCILLQHSNVANLLKRTDKIKTHTNIDFFEKRYVFITIRHCDGVSVLRDFGNVYVMRICIQDNIPAR